MNDIIFYATYVLAFLIVGITYWMYRRSYTYLFIAMRQRMGTVSNIAFYYYMREYDDQISKVVYWIGIAQFFLVIAVMIMPAPLPGIGVAAQILISLLIFIVASPYRKVDRIIETYDHKN